MALDPKKTKDYRSQNRVVFGNSDTFINKGHFQDKVVVITGGAGGIGNASLSSLARRALMSASSTPPRAITM